MWRCLLHNDNKQTRFQYIEGDRRSTVVCLSVTAPVSSSAEGECSSSDGNLQSSLQTLPQSIYVLLLAMYYCVKFFAKNIETQIRNAYSTREKMRSHTRRQLKYLVHSTKKYLLHSTRKYFPSKLSLFSCVLLQLRKGATCMRTH